MNIALFGGSFDPVHIGHIAVARQVAQHQEIDEVWMILTPRNPLKISKENTVTDIDRYKILEQSLIEEDKIRACDIELTLPQPNYTYNTLKVLQERYPNHQFSLVIGEDNLALFTQWRNWEDILSQHNLYVYPRKGAKATLTHPHIHWIEAPKVTVSSTEIRARIKDGRSIQGLVPDSILSTVTTLYKQD